MARAGWTSGPSKGPLHLRLSAHALALFRTSGNFRLKRSDVASVIIGNGKALLKEPVGLLLARACVLFPKLNQKREIVSAVRLELFQLCFFAAPNLATSWKVPLSPGGARFMSESRVRSGYQCP